MTDISLLIAKTVTKANVIQIITIFDSTSIFNPDLLYTNTRKVRYTLII